ncbi:MAG: fumarylacetoacetate hydrolase family protein [Dehalococcoidales bacterium]|jgi:2-keto-4-pentenoate hydratase/2-oxohepta-3-ene-1,7-dioic acid hydratase in catechol pathway
MKIVRFSHGARGEYGILYEDAVRGIEGSPFEEITETNRYYRLSDLKLLAPCQPSKIVALGVNYHSHSDEMNHAPPDEPLIFIKPSTAVAGPEDGIVYPPSSARVDYEGELGVVIKSVTRQVSPETAKNYILGYTCVNDVTARDLQAKDKQWTRAKGFDTFCPIGPCIETEISPYDLPLETRLNGIIKQQARTSQLIFPVYELVSFVSHIMTLLPGDIISTGTPGGIGPMQPGDTVEVKIEGIGTLRNYVIRHEIDPK